MNKITSEEIKRNLEVWLQKVELGENVQVVVDEKILMELKPFDRQEEKIRPYGLCEKEFSVPKDFDEPLPKEILAGFE